jgi:hypothetical protein
MTRLKLNMDAVTVESFTMDAGGEMEPGTAMAYVTAGSRTCVIPFCQGADVS